MMALIAKLLPYKWAAVGIAVAGILGWATVQHMSILKLRADLVTEQRARATEHAAAASQQQATEAAYRAEEQRRTAAQQEKVDAAAQQLEKTRSDAVLATAAADRLQQRVAALVAQARRPAANPGIAASSPPAQDAAGMLADLQRRADERAGALARIADERGIAGQLCERVYDSLTP